MVDGAQHEFAVVAVQAQGGFVQQQDDGRFHHRPGQQHHALQSEGQGVEALPAVTGQSQGSQPSVRGVALHVAPVVVQAYGVEKA